MEINVNEGSCLLDFIESVQPRHKMLCTEGGVQMGSCTLVYCITVHISSCTLVVVHLTSCTLK